MRRSTRRLRRLHLLTRLAFWSTLQAAAAIALFVLAAWALAYWIPPLAAPPAPSQPASAGAKLTEDLATVAQPLPPAEPDPQRPWLNLSTGTRHAPGCRYHGGGFGRPCADEEGRACKICGG